MGKGRDRRGLRRNERAANRAARREARAARQQNRQGFLTSIIGEGGISDLASNIIGGGDEGYPGTREDEAPKEESNNMMWIALAVGAFLIMNKK